MKTRRIVTKLVLVLGVLGFAVACVEETPTDLLSPEDQVTLMNNDANPLNVRTSTFSWLFPPNPIPPGVAPNGKARVEEEKEPGKRERLKFDIEDVEVIGDPGDPEFCRGFYEVVLIRNGAEISLPQFPGVIVTCVVGGDPQGKTEGSVNFEARLDKGAPPIDPTGDVSGARVEVWEVEVVRDPATGRAIRGPNGEPFVIEQRLHIAVEGVLN